MKRRQAGSSSSVPSTVSRSRRIRSSAACVVRSAADRLSQPSDPIPAAMPDELDLYPASWALATLSFVSCGDLLGGYDDGSMSRTRAGCVRCGAERSLPEVKTELAAYNQAYVCACGNVRPPAKGVEADAKGVEADAKGVEADAKGVEADAKGVEADAKGVEADAKGVEADDTAPPDTKGPGSQCTCPIANRLKLLKRLGRTATTRTRQATVLKSQADTNGAARHERGGEPLTVHESSGGTVYTKIALHIVIKPVFDPLRGLDPCPQPPI
eukprot:505774-Prorocentrum_minimum.AAC.1